MDTLRFSFIDTLHRVHAEDWNELVGVSRPFINYEFLYALEISGATTERSGWIPHHCLVRDQFDCLVAIVPLYIKTHSWGEYVFDWSWADAYRRSGRDYYPKLIGAIPFTPVEGPRIIISHTADTQQLLPQIVARIIAECDELGLTGCHVLFPDARTAGMLEEQGLGTRMGVQFHWFNRGFSDFADYLDRMVSRKRKSINKERREVSKQSIDLHVVEGEDIDSESWERFYQFYRATYLKRSGHSGYLNQSFFSEIADTCAAQIVMIEARKNGRPIAAALNFKDRDTLYGRYWGCLEEYEFLHFETCYYQGIDYCIQTGRQAFNAGAQGEHKLQRGFEPVKTWSNHYLCHDQFAYAIDRFIKEERIGLEQYIDQANALLPFKKSVGQG